MNRESQGSAITVDLSLKRIEDPPYVVQVLGAERSLTFFEGTAKAATLINGPQEGDPNPCLGGGSEENTRALQYVLGILCAGESMQIVELSDGCVASLKTLGVGVSGDPLKIGCVESSSQLIHGLAPGPKAVRSSGITSLNRASK